MPQTVDRSTLLGYFERRKKPTQPQYVDLINTAVLFAADTNSSQDTLLMDYINEKSTGVGVTIESVVLNDGIITAPNGFSGIHYGDVVGNVTGDVTADVVTATTLGATTATLTTLNYGNSLATTDVSGNIYSAISNPNGFVAGLANLDGTSSSITIGADSLALDLNQVATTNQQYNASITPGGFIYSFEDFALNLKNTQSATPGGLNSLLENTAGGQSRSVGLSGNGALYSDDRHGNTSRLRHSNFEFADTDFVFNGSTWDATFPIASLALSEKIFISPMVWDNGIFVSPKAAADSASGINWTFSSTASPSAGVDGNVKVTTNVDPATGNPLNYSGRIVVYYETEVE